MTDYEGIFIVDTGTKDNPKDTIDWLTRSIQKQGGTVEKINEWGRRKLAYPIKKKRDGYYALFDFKLGPDKVALLQGQCRLNEQLLKYMIIRKEIFVPKPVADKKTTDNPATVQK